MVLLATCVARNRHHIWPDAYLDDIERASLPVIAALDRYERDHGRPPGNEAQLIPHYLPGWPDTGYPGQRRFSYSCGPTPDGGIAWSLYVYTGMLVDSQAGFHFTSRTRKWERNE